MNTANIALARHHTYALFSRLYLEGVTAVTLPTIQHVPQLAEALPTPFNADEAAADHQSLFDFNIFPYESIFLDSSGLLGGAVTSAVLHSYREAGFAVDGSSTSPDHIGHELALLAHLCAAEADAWQDDLAATARHMRHLQWQFLQQHLLRWIVPLVIAVKGQRRPFYTALAQLALDLIYDHGQEIAPANPLPSANVSPPLPALLDNEKTGLKEIATYLATPPDSGFFLSRDDIARLARSQNVPRGFGDRTQMLTNLLRSAAQFDTLPALLAALQMVLRSWQDDYTNHANNMPAVAPFVTIWQARLAQTGQILAQMEQQVEAD